MEQTADYLHRRFNRRSDHIPPVRCKGFTRENLAGLFAELGFKRGAEIGVQEGKFSEVLCKAVPNLELYCVDPYFQYTRSGQVLKTDEQQEQILARAKERLAPYNVTFVRKPSVDGVGDVPELDFVYIDGDHDFDFIMQDLIVWSKKVRPGGIVSGHDYYRFRGAGVVNAVDAYTTAHQIREWFIDDQRETSFFWAKT